MGEKYYKRKHWLTGETYYEKDSAADGVDNVFMLIFLIRVIFPYILPLILILIAGAIPFGLFHYWNDFILLEEIWDTEEILMECSVGLLFLAGTLTYYLVVIPWLNDSKIKEVYKFSYSTCIIPLICGIIIYCTTSGWNWGFYNFLLLGSICTLFFSLIFEIIFKKFNEEQKDDYYSTTGIIMWIPIIIAFIIMIIYAIFW